MRSTLHPPSAKPGLAKHSCKLGKASGRLCWLALGCFSLFAGQSIGLAQTGPQRPNALQRLAALHLPFIDGPAPVYYSEGVKEQAVRDQAAITACAAWYSQQLHVQVPVTIAVLKKADWERIGDLAAYPMAEARPDDEGSVIFMPDSFDSFPGQSGRADLGKKLDFIAFHETGHLFQKSLKLESPDLFMQEFYATMLATAYAQQARPELISAALDSRDGTKPQYTSLEDMDLVYMGVGFDSYDWFQVETVRLAAFFVKGQDLATLVDKLRAAFPAGTFLSNAEVLAKMDAIRPGFRALAGDLGKPTRLPVLLPGKCAAAPAKKNADSVFGVWNASGHTIPVVDDGVAASLPTGYTAEFGKVGAQFKLPSGLCIAYPASPAYVALK